MHMLVGDDSSAQWMVALVRETLHGKREGDEVQGQAKARRLVRALCTLFVIASSSSCRPYPLPSFADPIHFSRFGPSC
jgi:hypothetical protein